MTGFPFTDQLPAEKGSYLLFLHLKESAKITINSIGEISFPPGIYAYSGSAQGPGGLRGRVRRHMKGIHRFHWHIDYLLTRSQLVEVFAFPYSAPSECDTCTALAQVQGADWNWKRFGASDCQRGCFSHLVRLGDQVDLDFIYDFLLNRFNSELLRWRGFY